MKLFKATATRRIWNNVIEFTIVAKNQEQASAILSNNIPLHGNLKLEDYILKDCGELQKGVIAEEWYGDEH